MYTLEFSTNTELYRKFGVRAGYSIIRDTVFRIERPLKMHRRKDKIIFSDYKSKRRFTLVPAMVTDKGNCCIIETKRFLYVFKKANL